DNSQEGATNDWEYVVEAEVQDASRRVIAGRGSVKAVTRGLSVFLSNRRGYVRPGQPVEVDIATVDPANKPQSVAGVVTVTVNPEGPKPATKEVHRQPLQTDAQGKALFSWMPANAGYYKVEFAARDSRNKEVKESSSVWVDGLELSKG